MNTEHLASRLLDDEPDYVGLARRGAQLLPALRALIGGRDETLAARAASLAGFIDDDRAASLLAIAARSSSPSVRLATAAALQTTRRPAAVGMLMALLDDGDVGVRKFAIRSSVTHSDPRLHAKVASLGARDPSPALRQIAMAAIGNGGRGPNGGGSRMA